MNKQTPIYFISPEEATEIVKIWETRPNQNKHLYIAEDDKWFVAIDNTTGECYTEQFESLTLAIKWLLDE